MEVKTILHTVTAWRSWKIHFVDDSFYLRSLAINFLWLPEQRQEAVCQSTSMGGCLNNQNESTPCPQGKCGFWGCKTFSLAVNAAGTHDSYLRGRVFGQVKLWGDMIEGEIGYRAQYAYPVFLQAACCSECLDIIPIAEASFESRRNLTYSIGGSIAADSSHAFYCRKHRDLENVNQVSEGWLQDLTGSYLVEYRPGVPQEPYILLD